MSFSCKIFAWKAHSKWEEYIKIIMAFYFAIVFTAKLI